MSEEELSDESSNDLEESWIDWFCSLNANGLFCEIEKSFIEDNFNLYGLKLHFPANYNKALNTILDKGVETEDNPKVEVSQAATFLYGLIHARYILTLSGLEAMKKKYLQKDFGECPRTQCGGQAVLPVGMSDEPSHDHPVRLFCPKCREVYNCSSIYRHLDGAYFGTTFCHLFFMTFEDLVPAALSPPAAQGAEQYVPRVFGFKIHSSSKSLPALPPSTGAATTSTTSGSSQSSGSQQQQQSSPQQKNSSASRESRPPQGDSDGSQQQQQKKARVN